MRIAYNCLQEFISRLEQAGELLRIKQPVSPILEITEIADRCIKAGGKALLFENIAGYNVEGYSVPVLINAYASDKRMSMALGVEDLAEIATDIQRFINLAPPESLWDKLSMLTKLFEFTKFPPKIIKPKTPPCQEVVLTGEDIDLYKLPILQCWPKDGGKFITFPVVFTKSIKTGRRNIGMYRMQLYNKKTTGMHWHIHKDGAANYHEYKVAGKKMPVAVAIGTDPAVTFAATAPMPPGIDELLLAGFIRKKNVALVKCKTIELEVPATAEYVLEGYVDLEESQVEGPFGDHTGYYSEAAPYPIFRLTAITHRKNPVYSTTIVGKPPMEDCFMVHATSTIFLPLLKAQHPEIADLDLPQAGTFHNCSIISIKKWYPYQARKLMNALWGLGQMSFSKMLLITDDDLDIHDHKSVVKRLLNTLDPKLDLLFTEGVLDVLDHSAAQPLYGSKLGMDITQPISGESKSQTQKTSPDNPPKIQVITEDIPDITEAYCPFPDTRLKLLLLAINKSRAFQAKEVAEAIQRNNPSASIDIILVLDHGGNLHDLSYVAWKMFNNVNPGSDIIFYEDGQILIDVTRKYKAEGYLRDWPEEIAMDSNTISKVNSYWKELGINPQ